jgi:hypothetical protein
MPTVLPTILSAAGGGGLNIWTAVAMRLCVSALLLNPPLTRQRSGSMALLNVGYRVRGRLTRKPELELVNFAGREAIPGYNSPSHQ